MLKSAVFELVQHFIMLQKLVMQPMRSAHALIRHSR